MTKIIEEQTNDLTNYIYLHIRYLTTKTGWILIPHQSNYKYLTNVNFILSCKLSYNEVVTNRKAT